MSRNREISDNKTLPSWQSDLIKQILYSLESYYCHPEQFALEKERMINSITHIFDMINTTLPESKLDTRPETLADYKIYLDHINIILKDFDSHLNLDFRPQDIATAIDNNLIVFPENKNQSPKFEWRDIPTEERLAHDNNLQKNDPRNNYGFIDNPNIGSLYVRIENSEEQKFHHTPAYVLSPEGLYYVEKSNQKISKDNLILSYKDENFLAVWNKLTKSKLPYDGLLTEEEQQTISQYTKHSFLKKNIPDNLGYLKINYLIDPRDGADAKENSQIGPNAVKRLNQVMEQFKDKDAIILDLRNASQGGSPEMVHYLISFFINKPGMKLDEIIDRRFNDSSKFFVTKTPTQLFDKRIDILTDESTFSAREAITFHFQRLNQSLKDKQSNQDRFVVIGENTVGGAHPTYSFPLSTETGKINNKLLLWLPCAASTEKDWEGIGVIPDIKIKPNEDALTLAISHLTSSPKISEDSTANRQPSFFSSYPLAKQNNQSVTNKMENSDNTTSEIKPSISRKA